VSIEEDEPAELGQTPFAPPPGATEFLLVRHGSSESIRVGDRFPLVDGHGDPALAPEGHEQAAAVGRRLALEKIDAIYTTGLRRTVQTAEPLATRLGLEPTAEHRLREVRLGEWEGGLFRQKVAENGPIAQRMWTEERWDVVPGAESTEALSERVTAAMLAILEAHRGERVAIFTHGGVINQILVLATRSRPFAFVTADNASVSHLVVIDDRWLLRRFNDTAHLDPVFTLQTDPPSV